VGEDHLPMTVKINAYNKSKLLWHLIDKENQIFALYKKKRLCQVIFLNQNLHKMLIPANYIYL